MDRDTLALLGDCNTGIELAVANMDHILPSIKDQLLRRKLQESIRRHEALHTQAQDLLLQRGGHIRRPSPLSVQLVRLKADAHLTLRRDDPTAAELVANSCDMGVRSLCRSRNRYLGADHEAQFLAAQLIDCQEKLSASLRSFL